MSDSWQTPEWVLDRVRAIDDIALDPCAGADTEIGADNYRGPDAKGRIDGLQATWAGGLVFANHPYSKPAPWLKKAAIEAHNGAEIVTLSPASTGARWMFDHVYPVAHGRYWFKGRIRFIDPSTGKPAGCGRFWSVAIYYGPRVEKFFEAFAGVGELGRLVANRSAA